MRFRLIYPKFIKFLEGHHELDDLLAKYLVGNYTMPPSLALPIIAALTPEDIELNLTDDNIGQKIDFNETVDAVIIAEATAISNIEESNQSLCTTMK